MDTQKKCRSTEDSAPDLADSAERPWSHHPQSAARASLRKVCGADIELGNFVLGLNRPGGTSYEASGALLREFEGLPRRQSFRATTCTCSACIALRCADNGGSGSADYSVYGGVESQSEYAGGPYGYSAQDWGRRFLPSNGGCVYIDLNHLECCLPEVISAWDHVACWHGTLRIARRALESANQKMPPGQKIQVLVNNSDGRENSYGSHLNFLVTRHCFDNIFHRKVHHMAYLASYQVSSIVFTGQGKVGAENGASPVEYQLAQRADFFETLSGIQTTYRRPIVNSRDEALCGARGRTSAEGEQMARLHVIFFDNTLSQVQCLLKVGVMQIVLSQLEAGWINPNLTLEDPLEAVRCWSHDPTLQARARLVSGKELTAVELQFLFLEEARRFVARGGCEGIVPRAEEILAIWQDTLLKLYAGDMASLAPRLDWVLKLDFLQRAMERRPGLDWSSPQIKHLDHLYSSLEKSEGLYWTYENSGLSERVVSEDQVEHFMRCPPEDTRAWTRAMLLRRADPDAVEYVDWDEIRFKIDGRSFYPRYRTVELASPIDFSRSAVEPIFNQSADFDQVLDALGAPRVDANGEAKSINGQLSFSDPGPRSLVRVGPRVN